MDLLDSYSEGVSPRLDALERPYLGTQLESSLLDEATTLGISREDAQRHLLLLCRRRHITVERLREADFRLQVRAALGDRFLDERERELLIGQGRELFMGAPDPGEVAQRILAEEVEAAGALSERDLRQRLKACLAPRRRLYRRDWEVIQSKVTRAATEAGVDTEENDLSAIYDQVRDGMGVTIRDWSVPVVSVWVILVAALTFLGCWYFRYFFS